MTTTGAPRRDDLAPSPDAAGRVQLEIGEDGLAFLRLGAPGERMVTLTEERLRSLGEALDRLQAARGLRGVVVAGPGPKMFAAGADIRAFGTVRDAARGEEGATLGRKLFGRFEDLPVPVVGAIEGPCLGGGLEMALCFDVRVASDDRSTRIGLPEVKLGIVPGFGGTQRLTRLVGLPKALELILAGKILDATRARSRGVVDRVVPPERLLQAAREEVDKLASAGRKRPRRRLRGADAWLSRPLLRAAVARRARRTLANGPGRFYTAPRRALELCLDALRLPAEQGFAREARTLGELIVSDQARNLVHLFFLTERSKALAKRSEGRAVARAAVAGAGAMGAGIAGLMASRGVRVRLVDVRSEALAGARARLQKSLDKRLARRQLRPHEAMAAQDRLAVAGDLGDLRRTELFLEAVVEDLEVKKELFGEAVRRGLSDDAVIATNTSSLSVGAMAEGLPRPERVVGIHFFNPPEKMPLVEVVRSERTSPEAIATACKLAVALGKFPVVVADSPGFVVNRCLAPYMDEAVRLLLEGNEPEVIDRVMRDFGMPMGPIRLLDEVGYDVAARVSEAMGAAFGLRSEARPLFEALVRAGALGAKTGGGLYDRSGKRAGPGRAVLEQIRRRGESLAGPSTPERILDRLVLPMVNEAFRCLGEGVVESEEDMDLALVMGIGFPPFRGGIIRYARSQGLATLADRLETLAASDSRFAPCEELLARAARS